MRRDSYLSIMSIFPHYDLRNLRTKTKACYRNDAKQFAEKLGSSPSGAKARDESKGFIAALKALRHPKASFSTNCKTIARADWVQARAMVAPQVKPMPAEANNNSCPG